MNCRIGQSAETIKRRRLQSEAQVAEKNHMKRVFAAIDLSENARSAAGDHIRLLRDEFADANVKWVAPTNLHVTLSFFGDCSPEQISLVKAAVSETASESSRFSAFLKGAGVFPRPASPKVFWLGIDDGDKSAEMKKRIEGILEPEGFQSEKKRFRPHLTIARSRDPGSVKALAERHLSAEFEPVEFEITRITIYESILTPAGSEYSVIDTAELCG